MNMRTILRLSAKSLTVVIMLTLLCMTSLVMAQQQKTPPAQGRRPLPKPPTGSRGFEKYSGKDVTTRLVAAGATREVVTPRKPLAPLEGRAYNNHPFFAWQASFGSKSYHFVLYDGDMYVDKTAKIIYEKDIPATEFSYPADAPKLEPGKLYSWRVSTPSTNGREEGPSVNFRILAGNEAAEVKQAIEQAQLAAPKSIDEYLDLAVVFENYGIWYDALQLANEVATQHPDHTGAQTYYDELLNKLDEKPKP